MELLTLVLEKFEVTKMQVFDSAFKYLKMRINPGIMNDIICSCFVGGGSNKTVLARVPGFVEDFCLDLLAGRAKLPKLPTGKNQ